MSAEQLINTLCCSLWSLTFLLSGCCVRESPFCPDCQWRSPFALQVEWRWMDIIWGSARISGQIKTHNKFIAITTLNKTKLILLLDTWPWELGMVAQIPTFFSTSIQQLTLMYLLAVMIRDWLANRTCHYRQLLDLLYFLPVTFCTLCIGEQGQKLQWQPLTG